MLTMTKPLAEMVAEDVMSRDVVVLTEDLSLREAAHRLSEARITGAPVVDGAGLCVGVLSATDFLRLTEQGAPVYDEQADLWGRVCDWAIPEPETLPASEVGAHMTADPVTATLHTPVSELARQMIDAHIHRIVVVDERLHPVGIVTSTDILAAVAHISRNRE